MRENFLSPSGRACPPLGGDKGEGESRLKGIESKKNPLTLTLSPEGRGRRTAGSGVTAQWREG